MLRKVATYSVIFVAFALLVSACAPTGIYHTVQPGQTLYRIALTYDVDEAYLARVNRIKDPTQLKVSQKVYIPGVTQLRKVPATAVADKPAVTPSVSKPVTRDPVPSQPKTVAKPPKTEPKKQPVATRPQKGLFIWPVNGEIINKFGKQGQKVYKGIEIAVPKGTSVKAAAPGKVIYSGDAIPGYGNLIILEHSDSFFSVYGYNEKCLVKKDAFVGQGDKIALSGTPPNGQSARLHFEIRKGKSAVNPILYLP